MSHKKAKSQRKEKAETKPVLHNIPRHENPDVIRIVIDFNRTNGYMEFGATCNEFGVIDILCKTITEANSSIAQKQITTQTEQQLEEEASDPSEPPKMPPAGQRRIVIPGVDVGKLNL